VLDLTRFRILTFDCYGTLVDWETGILEALRAVCRRHGLSPSDHRLLDLFARAEVPTDGMPFMPYREILTRTMRRIARDLGVTPTPSDATALADSLPGWSPFPDTVPSLRSLARRVDLGIISNVDDDLFAGTARALEVEFDWVVTAQQVGTYKPSRNNFLRALDRIGRPWDEVLHVAQSLYHDIAPAKSLGLHTVWVNRRAGKPGGGATPAASVTPDLEVPDLATLARLVETAPR
jgi:2-haloacid dehalogenase